LKEIKVKKITYGISPDNNYWIERLNYSSEKMFFWVKTGDTVLGQFSVNVFGEQNALDALATVVLGLEIGLSVDHIKNGLSGFQGSKRRSEYVGTFSSGAKVYDDYAHHPREIKETLAAFRKAFPKEKIIVVFQPHMYSRTKTFFNEFSTAFSDIDEVIMSEIFPSFREPIDKDFSSRLIAEQVKKYGTAAVYFPDLSDVVKYLVSQKLDKNVVLITMGAGDVYKVGREILNG
jgi:UDP-N-acetylmuramate--alanine ligase